MSVLTIEGILIKEMMKMAGLTPFNRRQNMLSHHPVFGDFPGSFDDFFNNFPAFPRDLAADTFKVDVVETKDAYEINADLPGVKKEDIDVELNEEGQLTISATRGDEQEDQDKNYIHRERRFASVSRSVFLGDTDASSVRAKLDNGVLNITVEKKDKAVAPTKIAIE